MKLLIFAAIFAILFVGQTINRLPRDIGSIVENCRSKNWNELFIHVMEAGFFWIGSALLIYLVFLPLFDLEKEGWKNILNIFRFLGR
jgi:hypothetical protein